MVLLLHSLRDPYETLSRGDWSEGLSELLLYKSSHELSQLLLPNILERSSLSSMSLALSLQQKLFTFPMMKDDGSVRC